MRIPYHFKLLSIFSTLGFAVNLAHAQLGFSPSLNSSFLTELRARNPERADEGRDILGETRLQLDTGRELVRPDVSSKLSNDPRRFEEDLTGFHSPYQMGRTWFSPFYNGIKAPQNMVSNANGLTYGAAFEQTIDSMTSRDNKSFGPLVSPRLLVDGSYQIAPDQRVTFAAGLGLDWLRGFNWRNNSDIVSRLGLGILPGSSVAYDVDLGPFNITAYDRVSLRPFFGMLQNDVGIASTWQITPQWSWTPNYTFSKTYDVNGDYGYFDGSNFDQHTVSSLLTFQNQRSWSTGLESSMAIYRPEGNSLLIDDENVYNLGAFFVRNLSNNFRIRIAAGGQRTETDNPALKSAAGAGARSYGLKISNSPYYSLTLTQRLDERWSHELSAGYETTLCRLMRYNKSHYLNYGLTGKIGRGGQLTTSVFLENSDAVVPSFISYRTTTGVDLHYAQRLSEKLSASIGYSIIEDYLGRPYVDEQVTNHIAGFSLDYDVNKKTQLQLGSRSYFSERGYRFQRITLSIRTEF